MFIPLFNRRLGFDADLLVSHRTNTTMNITKTDNVTIDELYTALAEAYRMRDDGGH